MSMPAFMFPRYWSKFCNALGQPQLIDDERYNTTAAQVRPGRCAELTALLDPVFATKELCDAYSSQYALLLSLSVCVSVSLCVVYMFIIGAGTSGLQSSRRKVAFLPLSRR